MGLRDVYSFMDDEILFHSMSLHLIDGLMRLRFPVPLSRDFTRNRKQALPLSPREAETVSWIALGKSSWETGKVLGISEHTVNDHIESAIRKLRAKNRTEAVTIALLTHQIDLTKGNAVS
ncbi:MAG: helix-turn-helix transcriptional regulator [Xanthobacteraceae bacterium]|nr:helix-turn-helix transcriptional regulator [Xanthobacteraceae bacterium]MBY0611666.1 helix-turn-helix transcriptional regulator [Beijerinckiaceae bacterium]